MGEVLEAEHGAAARAFDSQNVAFWSESEGCYACYYRTWSRPPGGRIRIIPLDAVRPGGRRKRAGFVPSR